MKISILVYLRLIYTIWSYAPQNALAAESMPFMVSLQKREDAQYKHFCGGTIIHQSFVLTAAHCFHESRDLSTLSVVGGNNQLNNKKDDLRRKVSRIKKHDSFIPLFGYDIAIVEVKPKFDFSDQRYAKINYMDTTQQDVKSGLQTWLIGWDRNFQKMEHVSFEIIGTELCRSKGFKHVTKTEVCAVSFKGRGACYGDSGGPMVSQNFKQLLGLLSFGKTICQTKRIYVFTLIKPLIPWINENINNGLK